MYPNQMNDRNNMNSMNQVHLSNLFNNNSSNNIPNHNHAFTYLPMNMNNNSNPVPSSISPDNSANNSTTTTTDPSLFMPTIGAIDNGSPPITPHTTSSHSSFIPNAMSNTSFRFDAHLNAPNIQFRPQQSLMQQMSTAPPTQTVLLNPYNNNHHHLPSNVPQHTSLRTYHEQRLNQPQQMPLFQNENFNVSNLNVNPGFAVNESLPPNITPNVMTLNPINILNAHQTGPKTLHHRKPTFNPTPSKRGAHKFGINTTDHPPIITHIDSIDKLSFTKANIRGRSRGRPTKCSKKHNKKKKKKKNNVAIEFVEKVEWAVAHSYHQYCPFCVRDERKRAKVEYWKQLPSRDTLNKQQRREYDKQCKQLLQITEHRVKTEVIFDSGIQYRRHYDLFHKKYGFKCIYSGCDKESSSWYNFVAHLTQHDREYGRPFQCRYPKCQRRSSTKHNLIKHLEGVHKWKIINKEEPKKHTKTKPETESTAQWNGNFDLKNQPIINPVIISPPPLSNNVCAPPMSYATNNMNGMDNAMDQMTMNNESKEERVSNNNCIVSPHLITAISAHPFIDDESYFPFNHTIKHDNYDIFTPIYPDRLSPLSLHSRFSL